MQTQVTQTNTTEAVAVLSHADLVRVLGLAVLVDAGIARDQPGTTITAALAPADAEGEFTATVSVLVDHNFVAPEAMPGDGTGEPSLKSDGGAPAILPGSGGDAPQIPGGPTIATA